MKINNLLKVFLLGILFSLVLCGASIASVPVLNNTATNAIPDNPPNNINDPLKNFPLSQFSLTGVGFTYWSYRPGEQNGPFSHTAIDLDAPLGTWVSAIDGGTVILPPKAMPWFGTYVLIDAWPNNNLFGHLSKRHVIQGDVVTTGMLIGEVGNSGSIFSGQMAPHLHFQFGTYEGSLTNLNPLKVWIRQFNVTTVSAAGPILQPDGIKQKVAYTFLQPNSAGSYPTTVNISGNLSSQFYAAYPYGVRAVLYINNQRMKDANNTPSDQLVTLDGTFTFTNVTLPQPIPADRTYHIAIVLFDTEEVQLDNSAGTNRNYFVSQKNLYAVADLIARADVDLYVPEDLKPTATPASPYEGDSVKFDLTAPTLGSGQYTYQWDFGDGGADSGLTPSHSYSAAGIYSVKVLATDDILHQVVGMGKVQVTVQKKPDPNPPTPPGGPGGGLPGGPQNPNGAICGSSCGVLGGLLNYLGGKLNATQMLTFLNSGIKVNPNPTCTLTPPSSVCGQYYHWTFTVSYSQKWVYVPPSTVTHYYQKGSAGLPAQYSNIDQQGNGSTGSLANITSDAYVIPCNLLPSGTMVPSDIFAGTGRLPDGDYVSSDGHLITMSGGKAQDMGPDTKGPNGAARKPGFYPANGQSCG